MFKNSHFLSAGSLLGYCAVVIILCTSAIGAAAQSQGVWREVKINRLDSPNASDGRLMPEKFRAYQVERTMLRTILDSAREEFTDPMGLFGAVLDLPMPDGSFQRFSIEHSPVVEPELAAKYPELSRTYRGRSLDDPTATVRLDMLDTGVHAIVLSAGETVYIDPYAKSNNVTHISYYKSDAARPDGFTCQIDGQNVMVNEIRANKRGFSDFVPESANAPDAPMVTSGSQLRKYRLALAATGEYSATAGGTVAGALAAQVAIMNRVNGVFERDLAIRLVIVGNNDQIIYTDGTTDPYSNTSGTTMLTENVTNLNTVIGATNYDIGHVFSTGGGGVASIGVPCQSNKARGVTGLPNPVGDSFAIDYVAHEIGHQFGAHHTFNGTTGACGSAGQRTAGSAYEVGSGVSVMGYAGICGGQNLAGHSLDTFHVKSIEEIFAYTTDGAGASCPVVTATANTPPVVAVVGGPTFNIPLKTPFTLAASATDADGDAVTYDWQQYDLGGGTAAIPNTDADGARPIFRSYAPTASGSRTFPSMQYILNNGNTPPSTTGSFLTGELLPQIARTMNFQVIARDNRANGGGLGTAMATVVVAPSGPFLVMEPASGNTWFLNSNPTVKWNVGGSDAAPINATRVRILLSTDGGATWPTVLAADTANDGVEQVTSPAINASNARIRIEAIGNIFFDVSEPFAINATAATDGVLAGRIMSAAGRGVSRVYVRLSGPSGDRIALTNAFGYFWFGNVPFGATYTITPTPRKAMTFSPTSIVRMHGAAATDISFVASN